MHSRVFVSMLAGAIATVAAADSYAADNVAARSVSGSYGAAATGNCPAIGSGGKKKATSTYNPAGSYPTGGAAASTLRTSTRRASSSAAAPTSNTGVETEAADDDDDNTEDKDDDAETTEDKDDDAEATDDEDDYANTSSGVPTSTRKSGSSATSTRKAGSTGTGSAAIPSSTGTSPVNGGYGSGSGASSGTIVGYGAGTTGGGSGAGTTVTSCTELSSAAAAGGVIRISGTLKGCGVVKLTSDTSVIGVGADSGMEDGGLQVKNVNNVIIQNLNMHNPPQGKDIIAVDKANQVWIDHVALTSMGTDTGDKDFYDGLLDITHAADLVTVSYSSFQNHYKASLIGHSDSNSAEDTGFLHVTYHNNYWNNIGSRCPSVRFGTAHIFNNCYEDIHTSGVNSRMGAQVLVEANEFINVKNAVMTNLDSEQPGFAIDKDNVYTNSPTDITQTCQYTPPYQYSAAAGAGICASVKAAAGPSASL
ncbi:uncharacterized protein BROUX77_006127 [Berkeleyomyces rouxiae]|uniref:uncharacterized protein n=1 Tax=Berkeleyomyces rouxiae TaxID=2035830 RepID=UPI003B7C3887